MKKGLILFGILIGEVVTAQPALKLYAYSQVFTPGMVPQRDIPGENGSKPVNRPISVVNYYIYLSMSPSVAIQPVEIWVRGHGFNIKKIFSVKTPVVAEGPEKKVLVRGTRQKVQQIGLGDSLVITAGSSAALQKRMRNADLVLAYSWNGKTWYGSLKKIITLPPLHGE